MDVFLEILDGDLAGNRTLARNGLVIGRKGADLTIQDSKISSRHAKVELRPDGFHWLVDLGSANGIKVDGRKVSELLLRHGQHFLLGRTLLKVTSSVPQFESTEPEIVVEDDTQTPTPVAAPGPTWWDTVKALIERGASQSTPAPREVEPISPVLRLSIVSGPQSGTDWTVGYGPREVGPGSLDLRIDEDDLPSVCFRLSRHDRGVLIRTDDIATKHVLLNGRPVTSAFLSDGDVIEIKNTRIRVGFEADPGA